MNILVKSTLAIAVATILTACGGGSDTTPPPVNGGDNQVPPVVTPPSNQAMTATFIGPSTFTWKQGQPISVQLLDKNNNAIKTTKCISDNVELVTVSENCSALTPNRLGQSTITVTGENNLTAKLAVNTVTPKAPLAINSNGANKTNRIVTANGNILTWGLNYLNTLSTVTSAVDFLTYPEVVVTNKNGAELKNIHQVSHSLVSAAALTSGGNVYAWGETNGATNPKDTFPEFAVPVMDATGNKPLTNIVQIASASKTAKVMGLTDQGQVMRWSDYNGPNLPEYIKDSSGKILSDIVSIALNDKMAYAVNSKGEVHQFSIYSDVKLYNIELVKDKSGNSLTGIKKLVTAPDNVLALSNTGNVYAWGFNILGQLGDSSLPTDAKPITYANVVKLSSGPLAGIKDIATLGQTSYAVTNQGNVYAWGDDFAGVLGRGANTGSAANPVPMLVVSETGKGALGDIVAITTSANSTLALKKNGSLVGWGYNSNGLLTRWNELYTNRPIVIEKSEGTPLNIGKPADYTRLN